jgi:predicted aminopeptidase
MKLRLWVGVLTLACACAVGCSSLGYYGQSVGGHWSMLNAAKPVAAWLADPATPPVLRQQLELAQQLRDFAVTELSLPDNQSYRRYADLKRSAALWNVVAAPELSLTLNTWCVPVAGCVGYRGYFERASADALAQQLRAQGLEVTVYGVPAYSTLGKLPGAFFSDPLLSTFVGYSEAELARLIFHELAHQIAFAQGDTTFNESFATAVERLGVARWLAQHASPVVRAQAAAQELRREAFRALTLKARAALHTVFRSPLPDAQKRQKKNTIMATMREEYAQLKAGPWGGYSGYDAWFERANNAALGALGSYDDYIPQFEAMFTAQGQNFPNFYTEVRRLAALPHVERRAQMEP